MRKIKKVHQAVSAPIADLTTFRALPTGSVNHIDPFLFLNHHGPQDYEPEN
jgi:redox-sensitive bicupin YhaK (pirin superfamily)